MKRPRRAAISLMLCAAVAMTAGCAADAQGPQPTPPQFTDRQVLESCGELTLSQGEEIPAENLDCLDAAGEKGAELAVTRPTTEGDPITEYYRVLPGGGWQAFIDGTQDRHGGSWWFTDCPEARSISDLATCEGAPL